jgi:hypothetical protein
MVVIGVVKKWMKIKLAHAVSGMRHGPESFVLAIMNPLFPRVL